MKKEQREKIRNEQTNKGRGRSGRKMRRKSGKRETISEVFRRNRTRIMVTKKK